MRETDPNLKPFDPEEFASAPYLEAADEDTDADWLDVHERPTLIP